MKSYHFIMSDIFISINKLQSNIISNLISGFPLAKNMFAFRFFLIKNDSIKKKIMLA